VRDRVPDADPEDLLLFDDLLGIADPNAPLPANDPDARRRRLTALVNAASLARETPAVYVVEDAHWIDEVSESMIADFLTVIPQTPSLVMITYRPEYRGRLTRVADAQTIALAPLRDSETVALIGELLGPDPSISMLGQAIAQRAAGNPFFAEEIVRELAERGVLEGKSGAYISMAELSEVSVPATLQATIAARIDRLDPSAKRTLSAAAVVGSRFGVDLLTVLGIEPTLDELVKAELIDQVRFALADLAKRRLRSKIPALTEALSGRFTDHHAFLARVHLDLIDQHTAAIDEITIRIEELIAPFHGFRDLICTIPGISTLTADVIVAETGADMTRFPTAAQLASWAGTTPGNNASAGKVKSSRTRPGNPYLQGALGAAAMSCAQNPRTYLGARYRRIASRRGPQKANVAIQHSMLIAIWHMGTNGCLYDDPGADYFNRLHPDRAKKRAINQLEAMGYQVTLTHAR
jgi:transposase